MRLCSSKPQRARARVWIYSHALTLCARPCPHSLFLPSRATPRSGDRRRSGSNASSINSLACSGSGVEMDKILIPLDENERILSLQMALKCSDIGHVRAGLCLIGIQFQLVVLLGVGRA